MGKPDRVLRYVQALELRAITVKSSPSGPFCKLGFTGEIARPKPNRRDDITAEFWFSKAAHAELVTQQCRNDFRDVGAIRDQGWIDLPASEVADKINNTAALLGAPWKTADQIFSGAEATVRDIEIRVEAMRRNGDLKVVNLEFATYRKAQEAQGLGAMPYNAFLSRFTANVIALAASQSAKANAIQFGDLRAIAQQSLKSSPESSSE